MTLFLFCYYNSLELENVLTNKDVYKSAVNDDMIL